MAFPTPIELVLSVFSFLRGAFLFSLGVFVLAFLASLLNRHWYKRFDWSWFRASFLSTYLILFVFLLLVYVLPVFFAFWQADPGFIPPEFSYTFSEWISIALTLLLKSLALAFLFALLLMPLEFFGLFVMEKMEKKHKFPKALNIFAGCFASTMAGTAVVLFVLPLTIPALIHLIFMV